MKIKIRVWNNETKKMIEWEDVKKEWLGSLFQYEDNFLIPLLFTGLKNLKGNEIYVGDILKDDMGHLFEVKFGKLPLDKSGDCVCTYQSFYAKSYGKLGFPPNYECNEIGNWMEVIGNIYENPELLK